MRTISVAIVWLVLVGCSPLPGIISSKDVTTYVSPDRKPGYYFFKTDNEGNKIYNFFEVDLSETVIGQWHKEADTIYIYPKYSYLYRKEGSKIVKVDTVELSVLTVPERYIIAGTEIYRITQDYPDFFEYPIPENSIYLFGDSVTGLKVDRGSYKLVKYKRDRKGKISQ